MSIKNYQTKNGKTYWEVYVAVRSKADPRIRVQRRERALESKAKAERRERELYDLVLREVVAKEGLSPTWGEIVIKWEEHRRSLGDIQEDTVDDYFSSLSIWTSSIWNKITNELVKQDIRLLMNQMVEAGKSSGFQSRVLNGIKRVYTWAREEGIVRGGVENLTTGIKLSKAEEKVPEILSADEIKKLLSESKKRNHRWFPIYAAAVFTGMRSGELYALRWIDVDLDNRVITVSRSYNKRKAIFKSTKAGYFRTVPINEPLQEVLINLFSKKNSTDDFVFPRIREWGMGLQAHSLRKFCNEIGIKEVKFHALRACFATHLLSKGTSPAIVMKMAGWQGLDTMQRYTRLSGIYEKGATDCLTFD
jgi:integrase